MKPTVGKNKAEAGVGNNSIARYRVANDSIADPSRRDDRNRREGAYPSYRGNARVNTGQARKFS